LENKDTRQAKEKLGKEKKVKKFKKCPKKAIFGFLKARGHEAKRP
jgi:hypothetical protein